MCKTGAKTMMDYILKSKIKRKMRQDTDPRFTFAGH